MFLDSLCLGLQHWYCDPRVKSVLYTTAPAPCALPPLFWQVLLALALLGWKEGVSPVLGPARPQHRAKSSSVIRLKPEEPSLASLSSPLSCRRSWASHSHLWAPVSHLGKESGALGPLLLPEHPYSVVVTPLPITLVLLDPALVLPIHGPYPPHASV